MEHIIISFSFKSLKFTTLTYNPADPQESIATGLLDACVKSLHSQGMRKIFLDGISAGIDDLRRLGR